jgi:Gpi18-like mannosyltransferase
VNRWRVLFAGGVLLALVVGHLLRDTPGYVVRNPDGSLSGDIQQYVAWTRLVTLGGIQAAYSGTWPETYAIYAPVALYGYELVGTAYRLLQDPSFDPSRAQQSLWLLESIKFVAVTWHLVTALAIFLLVRRWAGERLASISATLYVVNPAALYDVAHWAQPDGAHALFSVLAVGLFTLDQLLPAWAAMGVAAFTKPQAWSIVPLLVIATVRDHGARGLAGGVALAALVIGILSLPFVVAGRVGDLLTLPGTISSVMPVVSADAHNLWWLVLSARGQDALFVQDATRAIGPLSYRLLAAGLVGAAFLFTGWLYWTRRTSLAEAAALSVLSWFTFTTSAHENHLFFALPLLALAWPTRYALLAPFGVISLTLLMNMVLQDQLVLEAFGRELDDPVIGRLRLINAAINVACWAVWSLLAALRSPNQQAASATVTVWSRHPAGVGLEATSD